MNSRGNGHQAVGVNLPICFLARFGQRLDEILTVHVIQENILPPVAPAHHMIHGSGIFYASFARHHTLINSTPSPVNHKMHFVLG